MRIAHVITRMILGGAQENTLLNCEDLIRIHGDEVLLITGPSLGPEGSLLDQARDRGVPVKVVPSLRRNIHPWRDGTSYFAVKKALRTFRPDVVHTHSAKGGVLGRFAASALRVPAIVHTVHGPPFYPSQGALGNRLAQEAERWAAGKCHAFVSVADAMTDLFVDAQIAPREKFTTIYSGMEVEPFLGAEQHRQATRRELGYSPEDVVIGKIARLFHLKGHDCVIQAAGNIVRRCPHARFLFVGDGLLRARLEKQIEQAGLTEHFQFTGLVPRERIPALISAMDVLVHASSREGLARALPQAMLTGRPAVSFDLDGAPEVVAPEETGLLVPPDDAGQLADALVRLIENPDLRARMGQEGRTRFADQFRHETMTRRIRELYQRLLADAGPTPHEEQAS